MINTVHVRVMLFALIALIGWTGAWAQVSVTSSGSTASATYTTVNGAFAAINAGTHTGAIGISITGNTTESTLTQLTASGQGTASYTSVSITTTGAFEVAGPGVAGKALIEFNGADNVTIDGNFGGARALTFRNSAAATIANTAVVRLVTNTTGGLGVNGFTLKNCNLVGNTTGNSGFSGSTVTTTYGFYAGSNSTTAMSSTTTGVDFDNILIQNNEVTKAFIGINIAGSTTVANVSSNVQVLDNVIGSATAASQIGIVGIRILSLTGGSIVSRNTIFNITANTSNNIFGVDQQGSSSANVEISRNKIYGLSQTATGGYAAVGIGSSAGTGTLIANNVIYGITSIDYSMTDVSFNAVGIRLNGGTGQKVYYNSVNLYGAMPTNTTTSGATASAFSVSSTAITGIDVRNNIFSIKTTSTLLPYVYGGTPVTASYPANPGFSFQAVWFPANYNFANATLNNNAYIVPNSPGYYVGRIGAFPGTTSPASFQTTVANWKAVSQVGNAGNDASSGPAANGATPFTADNDLTIPAGTTTYLESGGVAIAGTTTDYIGATRGTFPDMGAYEFAGVVAGDFGAPVITLTSFSPAANQCSPTAHTVVVNALDLVAAISATLNYSYAGVAQTPVTMTLTGSGQNTTWTGTIPAPANRNVLVTYTVSASDAAGNTGAYTGSAFRDATLTVNAGADQTINITNSATLSASYPQPTVKITEIIQFATGTGSQAAYPAYVSASGSTDPDLVELTNVGSSPADISGMVLDVWTGTALTGTFTFPAGTILPANTVSVIRLTPATASPYPVAVPASNYFIMNVTSTPSSTTPYGYVLKQVSGLISDVVLTNGYSIPAAAGISAADWSGSIPFSSAGVIRTVATDNNAASDWTISAATTNVTNIGTVNTTFTVVPSVTLGWSAFTGGAPAISATANPTSVGPFPTVGTYKYVASVNDGVCSTTDTVAVIVQLPVPPVAAFSASTTSAKTNTTVTLTDASTNIPDTWTWSITPATFTFVGGTSASSQNPQVQFTAPDSYSVTLTASNAGGSDPEVKTNYISVSWNYCAGAATSTADTEIGLVTFGSLSNGASTPVFSNSTANKFYSDFTGLTPVSFEQFKTYPISVYQVTSATTFYSAWVNVFIDWNNDGIFDATTERAFAAGPIVAASTTTTPASTAASGTVTIPGTATLGTYAMRVILAESSSLTQAPCGTFTYGEVEDYLITVIPCVAPAAPTAPGTTVCYNTAATLTASGGTTYKWYDVATGGTPLATTATYSPTVTAQDTFYVEAIDGCPSTRTQAIVGVNPGPIISNAAITNIPCNGGAATGAIDLTVGTSAPSIQSYTVTLTDSYTFGGGDGWASDPAGSGTAYHSLTINVNGSPVLTNLYLSVAQGPGPVTHTFSAPEGATIQAVFTDNGSYDVECGFTIVNSSATTVLSRSFNTSGSATTSYTIPVTAVISYLWSNTATTEDLTALAVGPYSVTATLGTCTATGSYTITQPATAVAVVVDSSMNNLCFGQSLGAVYVTTTGGTAATTPAVDTLDLNLGDTYSGGDGWITPTTGVNHFVNVYLNGILVADSVTFASAQTYYAGSIAVVPGDKVTIEFIDAGSWQDECYWNLTNNAGTVVSSMASGQNGSLTVNYVVPGPYNYLWSNGFTKQDLTGAPAGAYSVVVTDGNGCTVTSATTTVTDPTAITATVDSTDNVLCFGDSTGAIFVTATGGTGALAYSWSNSDNTEDIDTLFAGSYTGTITDANGCTFTAGPVAITEPAAALTAVVDSTFDVSCNGDSTGAIYVSATGGTGAYSYSWSNGDNTEDVDSLATGSYTGIITDANGCTLTTSAITVGEPTAIAVFADSIFNNACNGDSLGAIYITVAGGTPGYTYSWSNGGTGDDIDSLAAGSYTGTITDANGCVFVAQIAITEPQALTIAVDSTTDVNCFGGNDGAIAISVAGGTQVAADTLITPLAPNNSNGGAIFDLTVTNTISLKSVVVNTTQTAGTPYSAFIFYRSGTYVGNQASSVGWTAVPVNGTISNGPTGLTFVDLTTPLALSAGTYGMYIGGYFPNGGAMAYTNGTTIGATWASDANVTILQGQGRGVSTAGNEFGVSTTTGTRCFTGVFLYEVPVAPGYAWSNSAVTEDITGLTAGAYTVTVTDQNGCTAVNTTTVAEPTAIAVAADSIDNVTCFGLANGGIYVTPSGGVSPYGFAWSNSATTEDITGLAAGSYIGTITDAHGCILTSDTITVTEPTALTAAIQATDNACAEGETGAVSVTPAGGTAGYTIAWNTGATGSPLANVGAGNYDATITDANGCTVLAQATVANTDSLPTANGSGAITGSGEVTFSNASSANAATFSWNFGDNTGTSSDAAPKYVYAANGTFAVTLIATGGCGNDTFTFEVIVGNVGIGEDLSSSLALYPNPTEGTFSLAFAGASLSDAEVQIYSMDGKLVATEMLGVVSGSDVRTITLDRSVVATGVYTLRVASAEGVMVKRLVIR